MIRNLSFFTAVTAFALLLAPGAFAEKKTKSTQSEANWVKFDPEAKTVTLKIRKPGLSVVLAVGDSTCRLWRAGGHP